VNPMFLTRRHVLALMGATGVGLGAGGLATGPAADPASAAGASPWAAGSQPVGDPVADEYHRVLHVHTRWVEQQWDPAIGAYRLQDFRFAVVLGNAVLLTSEGYDAELAGVDAVTLRHRTVATIRRFAGTNRLTGGSEWGKQLFWDTTFELYFVLAAKLLWDDLDDTTRQRVDTIARSQAAYAAGLGSGNDPLSGGWTPRGATGAWQGDTKLEEMGVYAQAIAPGLAWGATDPDAPQWRERFLTWVMNASGLPAADRANPAVVDGKRVCDWNVAHNIYDAFAVENHDGMHPHYQEELWRTAGRAAIHFLVAGQPLPQALTHQPNGRELWDTMRLLASDAGEPVMPMVDDRYHLYGRDVIPLAFLAQVQGDRHAARAEADLAARLMPYLRHAPEYRLAKFSGEDKYEPEARAEMAIAYLFHRWRAGRGGAVQPVTSAEFFAAAAGTRDFGPELGLTAHQSTGALAAAVTKPTFVKFLWQPGHDNWLVDVRASALLPGSMGTPAYRWTAAYRQSRDGVDATATVLGFGSGLAALTTLPTGTVVYASTGVGTDEGALKLFNMTMPGVPGLTGARTFTGARGAVTLRADTAAGDGGVDELPFATRTARHVRMLGRTPATVYGYSVFTFAVLDADGKDVAAGRTATASSAEPGLAAMNVTDGNPATRWAVARAERPRLDSWLSVDLGADVPITGVRLTWEAAYGSSYVIQTSSDGLTWSNAAVAPNARTVAGSWVDVDGRAGLVVRGTTNPITVSATRVIAATGPASGNTALIVEGYPGRSTKELAAAAERRVASAGTASLRVSDADGFLSLFNLTAQTVWGAVVTMPSGRLYQGTQLVRDTATEYHVTIAARTARVEPPRFLIDDSVPMGTLFEVQDSHTVRITAPAGPAVTVRLTAPTGTWTIEVRLGGGATETVTMPGGTVTPTTDLARGRTTFPTSPIPAGMSEPRFAVDGDPGTAWRPGPDGRMVVDLGAARTVSGLRLRWSATPRPVILESSADGLTWTPVPGTPAPATAMTVACWLTARYVSVAVPGWREGDAELADLAVDPG
jgi:hypothetical protein